jgi:hypothetical protein
MSQDLPGKSIPTSTEDIKAKSTDGVKEKLDVITPVSKEFEMELSRIGLSDEEIQGWNGHSLAERDAKEQYQIRNNQQLEMLRKLQLLGKDIKDWAELLTKMQDQYDLFDMEVWIQWGDEPYDQLGFPKDDSLRTKFRAIIHDYGIA